MKRSLTFSLLMSSSRDVVHVLILCCLTAASLSLDVRHPGVGFSASVGG